MSGGNRFDALKRAALPALAILIIANFLGYAMVGPNGIMSLGDYRRLKQERQIELAQLDTEKARLERRAALLDPRNADPDLADELIRRELGLVRPDEVIIPIKD
jgi:cell division protein FtsB